ncbi:hypothetical protein GCM10023232_24810 [Sphingosinicella ginsenosidimutans]|uniref:type II secretion system protein N n=1 Tax=Allosphingosinicella ginsenosidimutans TaxID=1176539 RepID=UPI001FB0EF9D|nr:type II secretion system protein N [Sphingosinicella ginsenosidimutans]
MRLGIDPSGRLPRSALLLGAELLLLALVAVQGARLVWTLATPHGPIGDWRPSRALVPVAGPEVLASFDPFFRLQGGGGPAVVTALNLKLYGISQDRATGRGSAIVGLPDGTQRSFAVGEEIMPGVTLAEVAFDNVTIRRGGVAEQLFLDQSTPAAAAPAAATPAQPLAPAVTPAPNAPAAPAAAATPTANQLRDIRANAN